MPRRWPQCLAKLGASAPPRRIRARSTCLFIPSPADSNIDSSIADVIPGSWVKVGSTHCSLRTRLALGIGNTSAGNPRDAVRVVARDTVEFTFGSFLGWNKRVITAEAVAVWGRSHRPAVSGRGRFPINNCSINSTACGNGGAIVQLGHHDINNLSQMTYANESVALKVASRERVHAEQASLRHQDSTG